MTILARVYRGPHVESFHSGSIAVVDSHGHLLAFAGDPNFRTSLRSAAKPFQAIPLLEYGGVDEFELSPEEIALTCASHGGEPLHVSTAAAMLRKGELDESDLLCGAHMPYDEKSANDLRAAGEEPSPLHNNCSGKHAGMLLATRVMDVPSSRYIDPDHPIQVLARATLAEFAGVGSDEIPIAVDGCGVPAFYLSLYRTAFAYARLGLPLDDLLVTPKLSAAAVSVARGQKVTVSILLDKAALKTMTLELSAPADSELRVPKTATVEKGTTKASFEVTGGSKTGEFAVRVKPGEGPPIELKVTVK